MTIKAKLKAWKVSCFVQGDAKWELLKERDALKLEVERLNRELHNERRCLCTVIGPLQGDK